MRFSIPLSSLVLSLCLLLPAASVQAQSGVRIGYVNTERILRDAAPAKAAQRKLEDEFRERDRELQTLAEQLKSMGDALERDRAILTENERRRRQRDFADLEKEFQRKQREFREDLNQRRNEELAQVLERANRAIRQLADSERFDLIVQEAVFASPRIDITEQVLKALNN